MKGGRVVSQEASLYFPAKAWNLSKNTPALCAMPDQLRGTAWPLAMHEFNQLKGATEFNSVHKTKVMHPH